jgi:hypothetical protein
VIVKTKHTIRLEVTKVIDNGRTDGWRTVWKVGQVTDSTEFTPGELLEKAKVDELCAASAWTVTILAGRAIA